jgi:addiction module HigA family antidote
MMKKDKLLDLIPPGEILYEEFMKPLGLNINALARDIDVPPGRIIADTTLRLGKYFNVSPEIWLSLQADYEIRITRRTSWPGVEPHVKARVAQA